MTGKRQVGAQRDGHFFSPVNVWQVHGIVNIYHTWAVLPLGYSGLLSLFLSPKKFTLERKIGSKVKQNQNPLQSFLEVIQKDIFFLLLLLQVWYVNVYKIHRYFKNICLATYNVHKKNAQTTCPLKADSRGRMEALRASPWFSERCGEMGRIFETIKLNSPWAIHIFICIIQVYEILKCWNNWEEL